MSLIAELLDEYFTTMERQAARFEALASDLNGPHRQAVLTFAADLRSEVGRIREQVDLFSDLPEQQSSIFADQGIVSRSCWQSHSIVRGHPWRSSEVWLCCLRTYIVCIGAIG